MTATDFDPEAIAARVAQRENSRPAPVEPRTLPPLARNEGSTMTGTGQAHGLPVPTEPTTTEDVFDRLERLRAAKAVRSPIVLRDPPPTPAAPPAVEDRFVAPAIPAEPPSDAVEERQAAAHDPRCGQPLSGGGAPRGWVLMRIVGKGAPRRWCSPACAIAALYATARPSELEPRKQPAQRRERKAVVRRPRESQVDTAEVVRRYQAGETPPQIGKALGHTAKTIRTALDRAGVQRRDDRTGHSGGQAKQYPPELVDRVRALYTLHRLSQAQVAEALGTSTKVVQNVMAYAGIEARPAAHHPQHGHVVPNNSVRITEQIRDLGLTSRQVKQWGVDQGLLDAVVRGTCPQRVLDAYLAAHQNGAT